MQAIQLKTASGWTTDAEVSFPIGEKGLRPAVIFAHGGGCKDIDCRVGPEAYPFWKELNEWFLRRGFVVIRFYRGQTNSVRDDIELLLSAYQQAKHLNTVDPLKIGFFGHSEGTWQSVASTKELLMTGAKVSFVILNGAFITNLEKHSEAQLREIFKPVLYFSGKRLSLANRRAITKYLSSWSIPETLISRLDKESFSSEELDEVQSTFLELIRNYIAQDEKLSSWTTLTPVENELPLLSSVPVIINQGTLDQETPIKEVRDYLFEHQTKHIRFNQLKNLNHYFSEVEFDHHLPIRSWEPISSMYFLNLDRSLTSLGL